MPGAFEAGEGVWRVHQVGAFDRLEEKGVAVVERRGQRPHVTYWISVRTKLGRLAARLQMRHDRWLADHGFDPREWDVGESA